MEQGYLIHLKPIANAKFELQMLRSCRIAFEFAPQPSHVNMEILSLIGIDRPSYFLKATGDVKSLCPHNY
jgi:hypothetical protein